MIKFVITVHDTTVPDQEMSLVVQHSTCESAHLVVHRNWSYDKFLRELRRFEACYK